MTENKAVLKRKIIKVILFMIGLILCFYPLINGLIEQQYLKDAVATYKQELNSQKLDDVEVSLSAAREYNDKLYEAQKNIISSDTGSILSSEHYQNLLNVTGNEIMGSIEIPSLDITLPIYHGTKDEVLNVGAGHWEGSSLPVGGINTRTVITSHRGSPNSKLFTRLDEMEINDLFYLRVLNEVLAYKVIDIQVIYPDDTDTLNIVEGKDLATLLTCTPYGLNTHRLIITGERVPYVKEEYEAIEKKMMSLREIVFMCIPLIFTVIGIRIVLKKYEKERRSGTMQHKRIKKALGLLMMMVAFTSMTVTVAAKDEYPENQVKDQIGQLIDEEPANLGSITIMLEDSEHNRPKENVVFNVTKVADVVDGKFVLKEKYAATGIDLNNLETANEMEEACKKMQQFSSKDIEVVTNKEGIAKVKDLSVGVYLLYATDIAEYEYVSPSLISIPTWDELEKMMKYDVETHPKHTEIIGSIKTNTPKNFSENVKTGDSSNYMKWMYLFSAATIGILSILVCKLHSKSICVHVRKGKHEK